MYDVVPSNLVMKRVSPRWWLAGLTTVWGVIAMSLGFVRNYVSWRVFPYLQPFSVSSVFFFWRNQKQAQADFVFSWVCDANRPT
jgi:hypothetical protein